MRRFSKVKKMIAAVLILTVLISFLSPVSKTGSMASNASGAAITILSGAVKMVGGRAVKELSAYSIANDTPVLGDVFYFLCDPSQRAALKNSANIQAILTTVKQIQADIDALDSKIDEISKKIDKNQAELLFIEASGKVNGIGDKYTTAWSKYEAVLECLEDYAVVAEQLEKTTDEATKEALQAQGDNLLEDAELALMYFADAVENNSNIDFANDLENLNSYIWKENSDTTTYLGTLESYLRETYPFEHQITEQMYVGFQTVENMQLQIFTMYKEYISYKSYYDPSSYTLYNDTYFTSLYETLIANLNTQAESSGIAELMLPDPFTDEELEEMFGTEPILELPEDINTTVSVLGTEYSAYKVRENKTLSYFIILTKHIDGKTVVKKYSSDYTKIIDLGKDIYRPTFVLEGRYTDDGRYRLISSVDELQFADGWTNLVASLRDSDGCNLVNVPQGTTHILLYSDDCVTNNLKDTYWNMTYQNAENLSASVSTPSSESVYNGGYDTAIAIYKNTDMDDRFAVDNTWQANDKGLIENQTITIHDGQILDISDISVDVSNVTIIVSGGGTIISNPDITLRNSSVIITGTEHGDIVYITDLNVVAKDYQEAAFTVKSDCTVAFEGSNSFTGTSSEVSRADIYKYYVYGRPAMASHGILVEDNTSFVGVENGTVSQGQTLLAKGAGGGAGICINKGALEIKYIDVTATGSQINASSDLLSTTEHIYTVGAGIGASVSCVVNNFWSYSVDTGKRIESKGDYTINGAIGLFTSKASVTATGVRNTSTIAATGSILGDVVYSEDIGGVKMPDEGKYYCFRNGEFDSSAVSATRAEISSGMVTKNNDNTYDPEVYKISAYTKGSNGVTSDGIYIKINGDDGSTDWMRASECGNDKGDWSGSVQGISVGKITSVSVKTAASNSWYPGKITVTGAFSGESITVYGGRWIGTSEKVLSPDDNVYEITINTADVANAGTDSNIKLYLQDADETKTTEQNLSDIHQKSNAFEKGDTDTFWIYAPDDFGEAVHTFISSDHTQAAAGWKLDSFTVKKVSGKTKDSGYTFYSGQWFEEARTIQFGKYSGKTGSFYVEVKTQDASKAGTDSNIYLTIYGTKGNTGEINLGTYAGDGNDFERGDLDCFNIGYNVTEIGTINKIVIRKDNAGSGPDWKAEYIDIIEEVSDGQTGQAVRFNLNKTISDSTYTFTSCSTITRQSSRIDAELLQSIELSEDGSYTVSVDRDITISHDVFDFMIETGVKFTVEMTDEGNSLYAVTFDGSKMEDCTTIVLHKDYSVADGYALIDFVKNIPLPAGTTLKLYTENLGFGSGDKVTVLSKDENGDWIENVTVEGDGKSITFSIEEGKEFLIKLYGAEIPNFDDNPDTSDSTPMFALVCISVLMFAVIIGKKRKAK